MAIGSKFSNFIFSVDRLTDFTYHLLNVMQEAENDPKVRKASDIQHHWPKYHPDNMEECEAHAEIVWQMICPQLKEKWKKTLI